MTAISTFNRQISLAPMMDYTDRHFRYLARLLSPHILLYTEMIHMGALLYGDRDRFLKFHEIEHPIAIQLGGNHPEQLAEAAKICEDYGYDEINLNIGCPSDRVQAGHFGACLMAQPELVAECVAAIKNKVKLPVTVKTRLGIDHCDDYEFLKQFITQVQRAGCDIFTIHARKAWLQGLSPRENREIPPLNYPRVYQVKKDFPTLHVSINGGITNVEEIKAHFNYVDGCMIGREAYHNCYFLTEIEKEIFGATYIPSRLEIAEKYKHYVVDELKKGIYLKHMARHLFGLFYKQPNAKQLRTYLSMQGSHASATIDDLTYALSLLLKSTESLETLL